MAKVVVGMSGGVDSAVAAYLLKEEGYEVIGVTLRSWMSDDGDEGRCCEIDDARAVCNRIDVPYHTLNCLSDFKTYVTEPFVRDYISGTTPNPCIECNRYVKWERLVYMANVLKAEYIATGHYAFVDKLPNGRYSVRQADNLLKDQTYMLYKLTQEQLQRTLMPLGGYTKDKVREIAREIGLSVSEKKDSQDICFIPDSDYASFIINNYDGEVSGEGNFVDEEGNVLGRHKGTIHYTIGQRKGLGIAMGHPVFVKEIRTDTNEVVLCDDEALYTKEVSCKDINFLSIEDLKNGEELRCKAKVRYRHNPESAVIKRNGEYVDIYFDEPVRAATPGQSAVFYDDNAYVIGGGKIV